MSEDTLITIATIKRPEPRVTRLVQPGTIPPRPEYMVGDSGYVESVARRLRLVHEEREDNK